MKKVIKQDEDSGSIISEDPILTIALFQSARQGEDSGKF